MNPIRIRLKKAFDRIVYRYPLLNKLLRNLNKQLSFFTSFQLRPFGVLKVRLKSGVTFSMATNETSSVTKLLFWKGADNYEYTTVFEKLIARCSTFIDIGANTGYYALLAARTNPTVKVYAFEPASAPYYYLKENVTINHLESSVHTFAAALADKEGHLEFFELDNPEGYHTKYNLAGTGTLKKGDVANQRFVTTRVPSQTLDNFVQHHALPAVDLIKMDTEGTENLILTGAANTLSTHRPIIICELLFQVIEHDLERIMRTYGYDFYNYKNGKLIKTETLIRQQDNGVRDCFFVHPEKFSWIKESVIL